MFRTKPKIAIAHDFLYTYAGAERVLEQIIQIYPDAELFSLFDFLPPGEREFIAGKPVSTSFIQRLPMARKKHRSYLPLMPLAIEQLDVSGFDIIISSSYLVAKGVVTGPDQLHICYCHTPARFAWDLQHSYLNESGLTGGLKSMLARTILHYIRNWDVRSAHGVDVFISNSDYVGRRIRKFYRRSSTVIYPPVAVEQFTLQTRKEDFYLAVSRLVPYKRMDLIIEAFGRMPDKRLIVIGDGPERNKISAMATSNVTLKGHQPLANVKRCMRFARAFVFAAEEDFGIVPVEAQACGTPVIALAKGGVTESVIDGKSGFFFAEQSVPGIIAAVQRFEAQGVEWSPSEIRKHTMPFSCVRFRQHFKELVERSWASFERNGRVVHDEVGDHEEAEVEVRALRDESLSSVVPQEISAEEKTPIVLEQ